MITAIMPKPSKFTVPTIEYLREYGKTKTWELFVRDEAPRYGVDTAWGTGQLTDYFETELEAYMTAYKRDIDPLFHLNAQFRKDAEEFHIKNKVSYKNELTCHRINRGCNEIVEEYENMVYAYSQGAYDRAVDNFDKVFAENFPDKANQCVIDKDELELLRATRWYCCSDISDELMVQMYRRRSDYK